VAAVLAGVCVINATMSSWRRELASVLGVASLVLNDRIKKENQVPHKNTYIFPSFNVDLA
jgi:hypothetical protein